MRKRKYIYWFPLLSACLMGNLLTGCVEELKTEHYYTFTGQTVAQYLEANSDKFSSFYEILGVASNSNTNFLGLLSAYGEYTCFAPDNNAIKEYLDKRGLTQVSQLTFLQCDSIARTHIIKALYFTKDLPDGTIPTYNMSFRFLGVSYATDAQGNREILVNKVSQLTAWDIECENGVVHTVNHVLEPSNELLPEVIGNIPFASLFSQALKVTHLDDSLLQYRDESYVAQEGTYDRYGMICYYPPTRLIGHTAFIEPDSIYNQNGIFTVEDMFKYAKAVYDETYPQDAGRYDNDYTSRKNPLNRFVAYHLLKSTLTYNNMNNNFNLYTKYEPIDYYETMCPNTIMQITQTASTGKRINRRIKTGKFNIQGTLILSPSENSSNYDQSALNGIIHYLGDILTYNTRTKDIVLGTRLRIDASSFMNELISNNIRNNQDKKLYVIPQNYDTHITSPQGTIIIYEYPRNDYYWCWEGDEFYARGNNYDFTLRLPPVPAGTYEVRIGYVAQPDRGVAQMYFGDEEQFKAKKLEPCGIPLDLSRGGLTNPHIGWVPDTNYGRSEADIRNDKALHNRGYMKAPDCLFSGSTNARTAPTWLRRIVTTRTIDDAPHYLRIRSVVENSQAEFMLDWVEMCPKSVYDGEEKEDIH